jgi:hypothetical protein
MSELAGEQQGRIEQGFPSTLGAGLGQTELSALSFLLCCRLCNPQRKVDRFPFLLLHGRAA